MPVEYSVKSELGQFSSAKVFRDRVVVATIQRELTGDTLLFSSGGDSWRLSQRVDGEYRPFSIIVKTTSPRSNSMSVAREILKIRDHLFFHNRKMYMLSNVPEGRMQHHIHKGPKYICRLDNFPFEDPSEVDSETRSRLRRFRGVPVGEISGIGHDGHRVWLENELLDIGLPLSASAFLLYTTASWKIRTN